MAALPPAPGRGADAGGSECEFGTYLPVASRPFLLVLRRRCKNQAKDFGDRILAWRWRGGAAHEASIVRLPRGHRIGQPEKCLAVLPSAGDAAGSSVVLLSLIVLEHGEIKVWAREKSRAGSTWVWKVWHIIQEASIPRPMNLCNGWLSGAELSWFYEGSGALFLRAGDETMSPLLLDLESMEVSKVEARKWELNLEPEFCNPDPASPQQPRFVSRPGFDTGQDRVVPGLSLKPAEY